MVVRGRPRRAGVLADAMTAGKALIVPATSGASGLVTFIGAIAHLELTQPPAVMVVPDSDLAFAVEGRLETVITGESVPEMVDTLLRTRTAFTRIETHGPRALLAVCRAGLPRRHLAHVFHEPPRFRGARGAAELALCLGLDVAANSPWLARHVGRLRLREVQVLPPVVLSQTRRFDNREARRRLGLHGRDEVLIGVVGRLHPGKRPELALEAAAAVAPGRRERIRVVFVGEGPARAALEARAGELCVRASFAGHVRAAAALMSAFDAVLGTCPSETFGLALLEAALAGVPVAAVRSPGASLTTRDGRLAPMSSPYGQALAVALESALDAPSQQELRRDVLARFGPDVLRETYERRYGVPPIRPSRSASGPPAAAR